MIKKTIVIFFAVLFCFTVMGCSGSLENNEYEDLIQEQAAVIEEQQLQLEKKDETITELKRELSVAKSNLMAVEEELNSTINLEAEPEEIVEETPRSINEIKTEMRDIMEEVIEKEFGGKLTKFIVTDTLDYIEVGYNTMWASADRVKKEMHDVASFFVEAEVINTTVDITSTTDSGKVYNSITTPEMLIKMSNYEMDYNEWLQEVF